MKTKLLLSFSMLAFFNAAYSQSNPTPFNLGSGNYSFTQWDAASAAGTYPANAMIHIHTTSDPGLADEPTGDWVCLYNIASRSRVIGEGTDGISFLNTSNYQDDQTRCGNGPSDVGGYLGEFVVALNTSGRNNIAVSWLNGLITQGDTNHVSNGVPREYAIKLQYRVGTSAAWADVPGAPTYSSIGQTEGSNQNYGPVVLPASCNNQPVVQVRWKYHFVAANDGGSRPRIRLDEITVSSDTITGLEEMIAQDILMIYPNPAENYVNFSKKISGSICSSTGQLVKTFSAATTLSLEGIEPGAYYISTPEGSISKLFVR